MPEVSGRTAANLLLAAGGALVGISAVAFAAVSWGTLGTGGRAAILLAVSAAALAAPWPLRRHGLGATAEAAAAIGLALTVLDAFLTYQLLLADTAVAAPAAGAAIATAVLAVAWAVYGTVAPVRGPRLAAIGLAQFPLPFAALALAPNLASVTLALVGTAGGDLIVADLAGRRHARPEWTGSLVAAIVAGSYGVLPALAAAAAVPDERESLRLSAVLLLAAAVALAGIRPARRAGMARRARQPEPLAQPHPTMPLAVSPLLPAPLRTAPRWLSASGALAAVSGALLAAGLALPAGAALPGGWAAGAFALVAAAVAAVAWWGPRRRDAHPAAGLAAGAAGLLAASGMAVLPAAAAAVLGPLYWVARPWSGGPAAARDALAPGGVEWYGSAATPLVLALVSLACWRLPAPARSRCRVAALTVAVLAAMSLPLAANLPYSAAIAALTLLSAALLVAAAAIADRILAGTAAVAGLTVAATAAAWSLTRPAVTITVLAVLLAGAAAGAAISRTRLPAALTAAAAVATAAGLASAVTLASGWPASHAGFAVLGVAALAQAVPVLLAARRPVTGLAAELSGWAVAAAGTALTLGRPGTASAGLTVAGLLCLGAAARRDRRPLFWAGLALLSGALWAWLAAAGVHAPEPYAAPAAAAALGFGWHRSRHGARAASWVTYGPGLGLLLVPSLMAAWQDQGWLRPLLLGLLAAAVMLAGGRARLQAPLLIGGTVAVLDAGRQLAGPAVRLAGVLPGWVPFAVTGAILLTTGATYEARVRDLGRIRAALSRLS